MNIGLYQSASALSGLERWQESVSQNIASSQTAGYRKRTTNFSAEMVGELRTGTRATAGHTAAVPVSFTKASTGISFAQGVNQATRRELDVAIQGNGFFEVQRDDGSKAYTRSGEFRLSADRTLTTSDGNPVLSDGGSPITLVAGGGPVTITADGTISQGDTALGKISVQKFANNADLIPLAGGLFAPGANSRPEAVEDPGVMQGYVEASNISSLREMVDLILVSRAYEANQKVIQTVDDEMDKTLNALG